MTTTLKEIPLPLLKSTIKSSGLRIETGPFTTLLRTQLPDVIENLCLLYKDHIASTEKGFSDFHLDVLQPKLFRRWYKPQVNFSHDGISPFSPLPRQHAYAIFEWGLNWCIANYANNYLMIHSAVLEKNGYGVILPGVPGAGKSTLTAALALSEWRLFSDEMALIEPSNRVLISNPRPISLKNESISIIKKFSPKAIFGMQIHETTKGTVSHMRPPAESVARAHESATPSAIVFPRYQARSETALTPITKSRAFMSLCDNAFNYNIQGKKGFEVLKDIISRCDCYQLEYSQIDEAIETFDQLSQSNISH